MRGLLCILCGTALGMLTYEHTQSFGAEFFVTFVTTFILAAITSDRNEIPK
jgi:hypothetical protein